MNQERTRELRAVNAEIRDILDGIQQGICTVDPELRVNAQYSKHMNELFCAPEIAGARTERTKRFRAGARSFAEVATGRPLHFRDASGRWRDSRAEFQLRGGRLVADAFPFHVTADRDGVSITIPDGDGIITFLTTTRPTRSDRTLRTQIDASGVVVETVACGMSWALNPTSDDAETRRFYRGIRNDSNNFLKNARYAVIGGFVNRVVSAVDVLRILKNRGRANLGADTSIKFNMRTRPFSPRCRRTPLPRGLTGSPRRSCHSRHGPGDRAVPAGDCRARPATENAPSPCHPTVAAAAAIVRMALTRSPSRCPPCGPARSTASKPTPSGGRWSASGKRRPWARPPPSLRAR